MTGLFMPENLGVLANGINARHPEFLFLEMPSIRQIQTTKREVRITNSRIPPIFKGFPTGNLLRIPGAVSSKINEPKVADEKPLLNYVPIFIMLPVS